MYAHRPIYSWFNYIPIVFVSIMLNQTQTVIHPIYSTQLIYLSTDDLPMNCPIFPC